MCATRKRRGDAVHAVDAQDLFIQVDFADEVGTESRSNDLDLFIARLALDVTTQIGEDTELLLVADVGADVRAQAIGAQREMRALCANGILVDHFETHGTACDLGDEGRGNGGILVTSARVHATLVAQGRLAHEREIARGAARVGRREGRALQKHVGGRLGDLAVEAAHDAREGDGVFAISDERHIAGERALLAIEGRELLAIARGTHAHMMLAVRSLGEGAQVESV